MQRQYENYFQACAYLDSLNNLPQPDYMRQKNRRSAFLRRFEYFLNLLDNPHKNFQYIHVGGTSGKGSVSTMIHAILTEAGYTAGLYTSPYVTTPIEKIKVGRLLISPDEFVAVLNEIKPAIDTMHLRHPHGRPSWFEIYTAMALIYFKKKKCTHVVLEVGCGGAYDATNVIKTPLVTIINKVGLDHQEILGKTITEIAQTKSGIIKKGTYFLTPYTNSPRVLKILKKKCDRTGALFQMVHMPKKPFLLKMDGTHQQLNAEIARQACQKLAITETHIRTGLKEISTLCRFETVQKKPLVILDGAHNESKVKSVTAAIKNLTYKKLYLIIALTSKKNPSKIFKELATLADEVFCTRYQTSTRHAYPPKKIAERLRTKAKKHIYLDPHQALAAALARAEKNDVVLVTGSFFLAGDLRKRWRSELSILNERKI